MSRIQPVAQNSWQPAPVGRDDLTAALERGGVVYFPDLSFPLGSSDAGIFSEATLSTSKNTSFDPATGRIGGTTLSGADLERLGDVMRRFSSSAQTLVERVFPRYRGRLALARASFRPAEIAGRAISWRKDDTRLHVDSFPASPVQGRRILRVFSNVNPSGRSRVWRVGGDFASVAARFAPALTMPTPGSGWILRLLHITKSTRTAYDALMLQLHDRMKEDAEFQQTCEQETFEFPSGTTWLTFTDAVGHAAMSGQYQLEQTLLLPIDAMIDEQRSPLRILERIKARRLV